ncbi:MAG: hypothetical protein WD335_03735 [Candidatus Paceibacterota bacterium]
MDNTTKAPAPLRNLFNEFNNAEPETLFAQLEHFFARLYEMETKELVIGYQAFKIFKQQVSKRVSEDDSRIEILDDIEKAIFDRMSAIAKDGMFVSSLRLKPIERFMRVTGKPRSFFLQNI